MTNQQIFETLAENEMRLFYAMRKHPEDETLAAAHKAAREALITFAAATGCHN